jgi:7-cyano-7-deazaguanine synthase
MDSVAALHWFHGANLAHESVTRDIRCLLVDYGQPHRDNELFQAERVCERLGVPRARIAIADALRTGLGISGRVTDHDGDSGTNAAFLPCRNLALLSMAVSRACAWWPADRKLEIVIGACKDDADAFPDCRQAFFKSAEHALSLGSERKVSIVAPWLRRTKRELLARFSDLPEALEDIRRSWSCYRGGAEPCGRCTACVLRAQAFGELGMEDLSTGVTMRGGDVMRASR